MRPLSRQYDSATMSEQMVGYTFDGEALTAIRGQSIAAAMISHEMRITRSTRFGNSPRGIFCGIGSCFDCLVVVNGILNQRACITEVRDGMKIETQRGAGS